MYARYFIVFLVIIILGCQSDKTDRANMVADLVTENLLLEKSTQKKIVIYQIMTRLFGNKKSSKYPMGPLKKMALENFLI